MLHKETGQAVQAAHFIHGNRLEGLADRLIDALSLAGAEDPLQPDIVVVAHPALGRWLQERMAARSGIAINVRFPLPSTFAWNVLRDFAGTASRDSAFSREALTWRIHAALPRLSGHADFEPVRRYLGEADDARQRYELSVALARVFDEYTMARPQWIRRWNRGMLEFDDADERWQAQLWRHLAETTDEPDRATFMHDALAGIVRAPVLPGHLERGFSVFGASHLPTLLLEFFVALAQRVPVRFYQPNPCLDYWGDIVSEREIAHRRRLWSTHGRSDDEAHLDVGHPLLASWGKLGREFLKAIHAPELVVHDDDAFAAPASAGLLGWLQESILLLDPKLEPLPPPAAFASIQLHACSSRRREIEVLRDALLGMIESLDDLKPHEIVVMSPRIEDYVPYIAAVFGDADDPLAMPYAISDVPLRATHPLIDAFARILALGESRFAVSEMLGLLAEPAIARRYSLEGDAQDWLRAWIADSNIRWGLDADFRAALGAAAIDESTWRFGFDRLLLGYALGDALGDDAAMLADVVPAPNVEGSAARSLGEFARFIDELAATRAGFATLRTPEGWKLWLIARLEAHVDTETTDSAEQTAIRDLREAIAAFGNEAARWLGNELLAFDVVRSALDTQIAEPRASRAGRFGITFCGMVPMRNVPHRVVCVLGLDAGAFPRRQPPAGFNLMRRHPRPGDRTIREDDRFLFLESLIAARDVFYMSHVDRDAKSAAANPPSPLVEELIEFLASAHGEARWKLLRPMIVHRHPMHPFAADYFEAGSATPSYDRRWWSAAQKLAEGWVAPQPFVSATASLSADSSTGLSSDAWVDVSIDDLLGWLRHPVKAYFRQQLPLHVAEAERDEDVEAFTLDRLARYQLADRLLGPMSSRPDLHRVQREGSFPLGIVGQQAWDELVDEVAALEQATIDLLGGAVEPVAETARSIALADLRVHVDGTVRRLVQTVDGRHALLLRRPGRLRGIDLARLALEHALLEDAYTELPALAIGLKSGEVRVLALKSDARLGGWIRDLVSWRARGLKHPLPAFPKSADAFAAAMQGSGELTKARNAAIAAWSTVEHPENVDPHNALVGRHREDVVLGTEFEAFASDLFLPLHAAFEDATP